MSSCRNTKKKEPVLALVTSITVVSSQNVFYAGSAYWKSLEPNDSSISFSHFIQVMIKQDEKQRVY